MKVDRKSIFAISIVVFIFTIIVVYEWTGAWEGYKTTIAQSETITAELLKEKKIPTYMLIVITIVEYIKHSWLCLLLAFIAAGVLQEFVPRKKIIQLMGSQRGILPYLVSAGGGPVLSMCSCSVIPIFGGLYKRGAGLGPAITFLVTAPSFNPAAIILTFTLINWKFAIARIVFAMAAGILTGYSTEKILKGKISKPEPIKIKDTAYTSTYEKETISHRIKNTFLYSWAFVKMVLPLILIGVILAGIIKAFLPTTWIVTYLGVGFIPILLAALTGLLVYTPTLVEVPFIRGLLDLGMGTGAAMAFLVTGPALSLPSILGVCRVVNPKVPIIYGQLMWLCGVIAGLIFWVFVPTFK